jgi:hypothetical protein
VRRGGGEPRGGFGHPRSRWQGISVPGALRVADFWPGRRRLDGCMGRSDGGLMSGERLRIADRRTRPSRVRAEVWHAGR